MNDNPVRITCPKCAIHFWVTDEWYGILWRDEKDFFCPNGHCMSYPKEERVEGEAAENVVKLVVDNDVIDPVEEMKVKLVNKMKGLIKTLKGKKE